MGSEVAPETVPLIPARMLNEHAYCPRLAYMEWVQGEFEESADTLEGSLRHRRVDQESGTVPEPTEVGAEEIRARSVLLSSAGLGAIARIDLLEGEGTEVVPIDYKKGEAPDLPEGAWEPERVQVCLQGLILRENGYHCDHGFIYFVASKKRVPVIFDEALVARTQSLLVDFRRSVLAESPPQPLVDSGKCPRCSLVGLCLPDETNALSLGEGATADDVRRLFPARDDASPVYIQSQGLTVSKHGELLQIKSKGEKIDEVRLLDMTQLCLFGNIQVTTQTIQELLSREIPICYYSHGGFFYGLTQGLGHKNIDLRRHQFRVAEGDRALDLARAFIRGKILNGRTLLRRNHPSLSDGVLSGLSILSGKVVKAGSTETLLGLEGAAARLYFANFAGLLKPRGGFEAGFFDFQSRNRRPPRDAVNALLSFAYSILVKDLTVVLSAVGFDPYLGFYHSPRYGRPALALDLMEEFRPLIADSVVIGVVNNGEIGSEDFIARAGAVALTKTGRRKFLEAYERRMDTLVTHPIFKYRISYRRVLEVQARLLGRYLTGEISRYPAFRTR